MTEESYVNAVVKKVKCTGRKRKEIRQQLLSDISAAIENGETLEDVRKRIGSAKEAAEEFNQNLSEAEIKAYRKNKRIKIFSAVLAVLLLLVCGVYWILPKTAPIGSSGVFDESMVEAQVKQVIEELDANDFTALKQNATDAMQNVMTLEVMDKARQQIGDNWGERKAFGKIYIVEIKQMGKLSAISQITVTYDTVNVTYTITLDRDLKLAGLYMR